MSQMGAVIRAVRRLFNDRGEMLAAYERSPELCQAARKFNKAIDEFEVREAERINNENKKRDEARINLIEQNKPKVADVVKVNLPQKAQPEITVSTFASELGLPMNLLLEQFARAGVKKHSSDNSVSEQDKSRLLDFLRKAHSVGSIKKEITQAPKQTIRTTGQLYSKAKEIFHGGKECSCGGGNKNCTRCDGRGWIDPGATSPYVPTCLPPASISTDTYGELKRRLPRLAITPGDRKRAKKADAKEKKLQKKKVDLEQKPNIKPTEKNIPPSISQKSKEGINRAAPAVAFIAKPKSGKPKRGRTKCNNCGQAFSISHVCPTTSRQPTYTDFKPPTPVKQNTREKDETKRPRRTPFDNGVSGTPIGATKLAGATRQDGRRADTTRAKRFNARFKKGR